MPMRHGRLHYREAGRGPAIVLLHINRQSSELYVELMKALGGAFHVLAPDYPGYGLSEPFDAAPSLADYADSVSALLADRGIERAALIGEAVGAAVAVAFATRNPKATTGLVLINCPLMADRDAASAVVTAARAGAAESGNALDDAEFVAAHGEHAPLVASPSWASRVRRAHRQCGNRCWQAADALLAYDLRAALARIDAPSLLVTGEFSPFAGFMPELRRLMRGARSHVVPDSRFGIGWEKAREVAELASEFLVQEAALPAHA
jgi:pimeloyl-ACP methyl ester carboxylesterase